MESPWLSNMFRQTIKQSVSMFLQGPQSTSAFWLITNFDPFFLLYGETVVLFSFFRFGVFPGSARAWTMFAQLKHLQTSVHPMPPTTHRHFELRRLSFHDLWLAFGSPTPLLFCPTPHLQPLFRLFFIITTSLELHVFFAIVTSTRVGTRAKSGSLCGTGIYQKHRKYLKLTYFSYLLFVRHSHSHLKLLKRWNHVKN